jgi:hypothetical protein
MEWVAQATEDYFSVTADRQRYVAQHLATAIGESDSPPVLYQFVLLASQISAVEPVGPIIGRVDARTLPVDFPFNSFTPGVALVAEHGKDHHAISGTLKRWFNDDAFPSNLKGQIFGGIVAAEPKILPMLLPTFLRLAVDQPSIRADFVLIRILKEIKKREIFDDAVKSLSGISYLHYKKICDRYGMNVLIDQLTQS